MEKKELKVLQDVKVLLEEMETKVQRENSDQKV